MHRLSAGVLQLCSDGLGGSGPKVSEFVGRMEDRDCVGWRATHWLRIHQVSQRLECKGMPVMATDHLDRKRGILRGCPGEVVAWVWPEDGQRGEETGEEGDIWNKLPACVLVRFQTKEKWRIDGLEEDNVYPVAPQKKPWYLDKGRRRPMLRISRRQFPLAPGFATTAHAAQGQTFKEGVVMDMHIGEAGDPLTAYIALTRVRDRHGLFVYRPFEARERGQGRPWPVVALVERGEAGLGRFACKVSGRKRVRGVSWRQASVRFHAKPVETDGCSASMPRMYQAACRKEDTMAVHGMQRMERRKSIPSRTRASAMHVLLRLQHLRKHQGVFRLWPPEGGERLFQGCVAANSARSKAMSGMRLKSAGLLDLQPMPNAKEKRGLPAMENEVQQATCTTGLRPMLGAEGAAECCGEGTRPCPSHPPKDSNREAGQSGGRSYGADQTEARWGRTRDRRRARQRTKDGSWQGRRARGWGERAKKERAKAKRKETKARGETALPIHLSCLWKDCRQCHGYGTSRSPPCLSQTVSRAKQEGGVQRAGLQVPFLWRQRAEAGESITAKHAASNSTSRMASWAEGHGWRNTSTNALSVTATWEALWRAGESITGQRVASNSTSTKVSSAEAPVNTNTRAQDAAPQSGPRGSRGESK